MLLLLLLLQNADREIAAMSWIKAADELTQELARADSKNLAEMGFNSSAEVMSRFATARKVTVNTARRQLAVASFLRSILPKDRYEYLVENDTPPFNTLEVLKRIHDLDPKSAEDMLPSVLGRRITFVSISETYQATQASIPQAGKRIAAKRDVAIEFEKVVIDTLVRNPSVLYGPKLLPRIEAPRRGKSDFAFALPDAVAIYESNGDRFYDGIEVRMPTDSARHQVWHILERVHLMATFFTHTWLILPKASNPDQDSFMTNFLAAKRSLGLPSVGVAVVTIGETVSFGIAVSPTGLSEIDRRHLLPPL
jgi:hypothetical protein